MSRPEAGRGSGSAEEKRQIEAVLAASAEEARRKTEADARLDSDLQAAIDASMELERLRARDEADRGVAFLEGRQKVEEEEARRKAAEEEAKVLERLAKLKAEQEEAKRKAEEAEARSKAEAEEARQGAEEEKAKLKASELETARRKTQELEEAKQKAQEEAESIRKAEEEEAARKAQVDAGKSWLERAMDSAGHARQLEDQGQTQEAMEQYNKCLELFGLVCKKEKSERVRTAIQEKMQDLKSRADGLSEIVMSTEASEAADILAGSLFAHPRPEASEGCLDAEAQRAAQLLAGTKGQEGYHTDTAFAAELMARAQDVSPAVVVDDSAGSRDHTAVPDS